MAKNRSTDDQNSILLSTPEFWLLLSQFAPALVLGVENPYTGWLAEEIKNANHEAVDSLIKRGWARPLTAETVDVKDDLLALSKVCAHPTHSCVLQISNRNGQNERRYFNFIDDLMVEHYEMNPGEHLICKYISRSALVEHVVSLLHLQTVSRGNGKGFQLPESVLFKATELSVIGKTAEMDEILNEAGLGIEEGVAIRNALVTPVVNASIAVIANQGDPETQHVRGFGILQSSTNLWVMSPFKKLGKPLVEFSPVSVEDIHARLEEAIPGGQTIGGE